MRIDDENEGKKQPSRIYPEGYFLKYRIRKLHIFKGCGYPLGLTEEMKAYIKIR